MERVLVFPSTLMNEIGHFVGFRADASAILPIIFNSGKLDYIDRARAEDDPSFKQIVPYVLLRYGESLFSYSRSKKGTESRLHEKLSIGVGGHINPVDGATDYAAYLSGMRREVAEEVTIKCAFDESVFGCVHDDTTPVGAVHFGVVHEFRLCTPSVEPREQNLASCAFRTFLELEAVKDRLESWSRFAFDRIANRG